MKPKSFREYLDTKNHNGKGKMVEKPPVEEVPDYKGKSNPETKGNKKDGKNIKDQQVIERRATFKEYMTAKDHSGKGKLKVKPDVKVVADMPSDAPDMKAPPTESIPSSNVSKAGKPHSYRAPEEKMKGSVEKGFGHLGVDEPWVPNIDTSKDGEVKASFEDSTDGVPQVKGESALNGMNALEANQYITQLNESGCSEEAIPTITAFAKGKFHPNPIEAINYVSFLARENNSLMETLIRTLKRNHGLSGLMEELTNHPEVYQDIALRLEGEEGPSFAKNIVRAMNDSYSTYLNEHGILEENALGPPIGTNGEDDDEEEEEDDDEMGGEDLGIHHDDDDDHGMGDEEDDDMDMGDDKPKLPSLEDEDEEDEEDDDMNMEMPKIKMKKKFPHKNMIDAMKNHDYMTKYMRM
jgi:hypothetical protein